MTPREISISRGRRRGPPDPEGDLNLPGEKEGDLLTGGDLNLPCEKEGDLPTGGYYRYNLFIPKGGLYR
jgi:hypothetical protein